MQNRGILNWKGGAGLDEFRATGEEAGYLVVSGRRLAAAFASYAVLAVVESMGCFGVPWLRGAFQLGNGTE